MYIEIELNNRKERSYVVPDRHGATAFATPDATAAHIAYDLLKKAIETLKRTEPGRYDVSVDVKPTRARTNIERADDAFKQFESLVDELSKNPAVPNDDARALLHAVLSARERFDFVMAAAGKER